ncbi:MAG: hypothetical protein FD143_2891 [Ignavibacteria bacterium]|nr:MAG: hypothetical protein FD143_2891 [Ignavibacteria bacterium]KAF0155295.1 MAG: hypothetical protein FD188_3170 [Ignavibacteria bacterium]
MKEMLPFNKDVLKWARISIGLSEEDVAKKFDKSVEEIIEWENGTDSPTYVQLERLAHEIYKRPIAVFFFPLVPTEENPKTDFRTLPDTSISELPSEIIKQYRKAKLYQMYLEELFENQLPVERNLLSEINPQTSNSLVLFASVVRQKLGITIEEQQKWKSTEDAFKKWRELLEKHGIFVFKDAFKNDNYSGLCLHHEKYPIIHVNNSMHFSRQIFTLFHELGHLLLKNGGVDYKSELYTRVFRGIYKDIEVGCNAFANAVLVPEDIFDSFKPELTELNFQKLADYFSVSKEVILRNYLSRGWIDSDYYEERVSEWSEGAKNNKKKGNSGNYYNTQKAYLGDKYINIVYSKYYQNRINLENVAEYFQVKMKNLSTFESNLLNVGQ